MQNDIFHKNIYTDIAIFLVLRVTGVVSQSTGFILERWQFFHYMLQVVCIFLVGLDWAILGQVAFETSFQSGTMLSRISVYNIFDVFL